MRIFAFALLAGLAAGAAAQTPPTAPAEAAAPKSVAELDEFIESMFKTHLGRTLCVPDGTPVEAIRREVVEQLKSMGVRSAALKAQVEEAAWTRFPCPFPPYRAELREAAPRDLEGVWLYPESSQSLRYGPKSNRRPAARAVTVTCEIVGFYGAGEYRSGALVGDKACPFSRAADLEPARARPQTLAWSMPRPGSLEIRLGGRKDPVESWDVFVVAVPFQFDGVSFAAGDLVAYLRDEEREPNAALEFRHLQRLR